MRTPTRAGCRFRAAAAPRGMRPCRRGHRHLHVRDRATRHPQAAWPDEDIVLRQHGRQTLHSGAVEQGSRQRIQVFQQHARLDGAQPRACAPRANGQCAGAARPTSTGDGRLIRCGAASGKFSSISSTASLLVVRRTHGSGVRPLGPGAAVGPTPPPGQGRRPGTRCPDAGVGKRRVEQVPAASRPLGQAGILRGHDARRHEDRQLGFAQLIATRRKQSPSTGTSSNPGKPLTSRPARATESHR